MCLIMHTGGFFGAYIHRFDLAIIALVLSFAQTGLQNWTPAGLCVPLSPMPYFCAPGAIFVVTRTVGHPLFLAPHLSGCDTTEVTSIKKPNSCYLDKLTTYWESTWLLSHLIMLKLNK